MNWVYDSDHRFDLPFEQVTRLIGGKAANLAVMATELSLPVPPAFTIGTAACNAYLADGWPAGLDAEIRAHLAVMEARIGRRFGDPADPLLVSVRSGAPVSMPGMMDTILNLGLNDATCRGLGLASSDPGFAANCRTRFEQMFRTVVGVDDVPDDPWQQLRSAIEAVFRSWHSDRAVAYREREGIADDLGTAVTIQAMVFGNRGPDSGTGVLFTRNPATGEPALYGDVLFDAQGEDVVAGSHRTETLSELAARMPAVATELERDAGTLERHHRDLCDIEFTIERGRLWLLQCRIGKRSPQAAVRIARDMAEAADFPLSRDEAVERTRSVLADPPRAAGGGDSGATPLATGLPASPGLAAGEIALTPEAAVQAAEAGRAVILVRAETSPDDIRGIARATGLLTSRGGLASHAAVVARGWGIPAVVGASSVIVGAQAVSVGGRSFAPGESITIDGSTGAIYAGRLAAAQEIVPEATILLAWADELGIPVRGRDRDEPLTGAAWEGTGSAPTLAPAQTPESNPTLQPDELIQSLAIRGYGLPAALAEAHFTGPESIEAGLAGLAADGLVEPAVGSWRLTPAGTAAAAELLEQDRRRWGVAAANEALDGFLALDRRMKETVTAWQMRAGAGAPVLNDHADRDYDGRVLADLAGLHADARSWLEPHVAALPRLADYATRLDRAALRSAEGDARYLASPRVDSYHGVWFELHEDLIRLAGRNRADEVAAGRA
ncbi:MAG: pyruvate, phosphate dikinase [Candidatus Limnocylindrales bacterium]